MTHLTALNMYILLDADFSDLVDPELFNVGLVRDDGRHGFYAELPVNMVRCNDFVIPTEAGARAQVLECPLYN
jgi:hypothetical protein